MDNSFSHDYALLISVGTSAYAPWSLPVTVRDVQALEAAQDARHRRPRRPALRPVGAPLAADAVRGRSSEGEL